MPKSYENTSGYMELQRILWRPVKILLDHRRYKENMFNFSNSFQISIKIAEVEMQNLAAIMGFLTIII